MNNDKDNAGAALKDEDRAGLVNALRKQAGHRSDVLQNLTPKVRKRVDALRNVQGQHDDLEAKFLEERAVIEAKYQKLYQPLYTKLCLHLIPSMVAAISVTGPVNVPSHLKPQPLLNILLTMPEGPAGDDMKDFMLELCLMLPARLSSLLPYLPCLMKDLVFCLCLKGSDELVSLGSRSLEFWVDNLNPDFLEPSVANVMSEVTLSIRSHLRLVLPFQKEPLTLECISMEGDGELLVATKVKPVFKRDEWMATLLHERKARVHAFSRNARDTRVWTDTHMNKAQRGKTNQRHIGPRYRFLYLLMFCPLVLLAWTSSAEATKQHDSEPEEKNVVLIVCLVILFGILMSLLIQFLSWLDSKPKSMPKSEKSNVGKTSNGQSSSQNPKQAGKPKIKRKRKGKSSSQEEEDELDHLNGQDSNVYTKSEQTSNGQSSSQNTEEAVDVSEPKAGTFVYQKDWDKRTTNVFVTETMVERRNGLEVVEGSLQGRQVYVKRGAARSEEMVNEILVLQEADFHPNIIRYFFFEEKGEFFTYCVEPWICSLRYLIKIGDNKQSPPSSQINLLDVMVKLRQPSLWETLLINIMRDVLLGIEHLHSLNIIHGDLTPDNIRIINNQKTLIGKIDGMGIARAENRPFLPSRIRDEKSEVFQPADQIDKAEYSSAVDMFALGCLIFHGLSSGKHPFGSGGGVSKQETNILNNCCDLRPIETFPEAHDLVKRLVNVEPNSRPTASETKLHPFFWNDGVKRKFFKVVCKHLRKLGLSDLNKEATVAKALGGDVSWFTKLPNAFLKHIDKHKQMMGKNKRYDGTLLSDLIEVIRNNEEHYQELPKHIKNLFPDGVYIYFQRMFPHLFMVVYDFIYGGPCKEKKEFREFFKEIAHFKVVEM